MDSKSCRTEMDLKYYFFYPTSRDQMPTIKIPATGSNGLCANSSSTEPVVPGGSPLTVNKVSYVPMMPFPLPVCHSTLAPLEPPRTVHFPIGQGFQNLERATEPLLCLLFFHFNNPSLSGYLP